MTKIKIGGRTIPLLYTTMELVEIQKQLGCTAFQTREEVFGMRLEDEDDPHSIRFDVVEDPERMEKFGKLFAIMGNAGLEEAGEKADLTYKWILRNMKPSMILYYAISVMEEILEGNAMEAKEEENGPVDEILEEEQAKKQQGS